MNMLKFVEQLSGNADVVNKQPAYYPLSRLPLFSIIIDEQLKYAHEQLAFLQQVEATPQIFGRAQAIARIIKPYVRSTELNRCYRQQLSFWKALKLSEEQQQEVARLARQIVRFEQCRSRILNLAQTLKNSGLEQCSTPLRSS